MLRCCCRIPATEEPSSMHALPSADSSVWQTTSARVARQQPQPISTRPQLWHAVVCRLGQSSVALACSCAHDVTALQATHTCACSITRTITGRTKQIVIAVEHSSQERAVGSVQRLFRCGSDRIRESVRNDARLTHTHRSSTLLSIKYFF